MQSYPDSIVAQCRDCRASSTFSPNHCVSITSWTGHIQDILCVDHFFLDAATLFYAMDVARRFSAALVVSATGNEETLYAFESLRIS